MRTAMQHVGRLVLLSSICAAPPAIAQHGRGPAFERPPEEGYSVTLVGGGVSTFQNLNIAGTEYLSGGPYLGASLTWQPRSSQNLAIRADLGWTQHVLHTPRVGNGAKVDYVYIGPEVVFSFLNSERFAGGLAGGGGGVFIRENATHASKLHVYESLGIDGTYFLSNRFRLNARIGGVIYVLSNFPTTSVLGTYHHRQGDGLIALGIVMKL